MASIVSRFLLVLGFLVSVSSSAYLESQPQASNQLSSFANFGGSGEGINNNGGFNGGFGGNGVSGGGDPIADLTETIPGGGFPGEDYPILASVPDTGFTCEGQLPGYYADTDDEAGCQVFHICQEGGRQDSFLCPNGTIFNQQYFVCDWWFNVDCFTAEQFFVLNAEIGKVDGNDISFNNANGIGSASSLQNSFFASGNGNYNNQGSASNPQHFFSAPGNIEGLASNPQSLYTAPRNGNSNGLGSASNLQNAFTASRNGNSNGSGSTSNHQNFFSASGNGNNRNRNGGHRNNGNGGNIQAPSHFYGSPN